MPVAPAPSLETLFDHLERDHHRLDALLGEARAQLARAEPAITTFREYRAGLERHCRLEEELLFPALERRTGLPDAGPTAVLRFEHQLLLELVAELDAALERGDLTRFHAAGARFDGVVAAHNIKEERVLYPAADRALHDDERRALVARLRAW